MDYATSNLGPFQGGSTVPALTGSMTASLNAGALSVGEMGGRGSRSLNVGKGTPMDQRLRCALRGVPRPSASHSQYPEPLELSVA
jgi:hypothetical protein